jgi:hypothetical protein
MGGHLDMVVGLSAIESMTTSQDVVNRHTFLFGTLEALVGPVDDKARQRHSCSRICIFFR